MTKDYSGIILSVLIALISLLLSYLHPAFDPLVLSIILGMLISNILAKKDAITKGTDLMIRLFPPLGIALYGSQLSLSNGVDYKIWIIIVVTVTAIFLVTTRISLSFGLPKRLSILLATGLSICGASAIAIMSPLIKAKKEEISISLIVIMIIGLTSIIFYPLLFHHLDMTDNLFTLLAGTTIPMIGQVKVTAFKALGVEGMTEALRYKLIRVSMLLFLIIGIFYIFKEREKAFHIPWFMLVFLVLTVLVNISEKMVMLRVILQPISSFFLSSGLAAIGLTVDFEAITTEGAKPLLSAFISWLTILVGAFLILRAFYV